LSEHEIDELPSIVSDPFAPPPAGKDDRHHGVDFAYYNQGDRASIEGEGVTAILPGRAAAVLIDRLPYGNMVIIETSQVDLWPQLIQHLEIESEESLYHLYAHLNQPPEVIIGQQISCGQLIGVVGKTGYNIPVPHLHLEIRVGPSGTFFESMAFYDTRATEDEMENYKTWRTSGEFRYFDPMDLFVIDWPELDQD
jgi:murein DD-endopeptidase MepM/ murein hydrolase activator NlpD